MRFLTCGKPCFQMAQPLERIAQAWMERLAMQQEWTMTTITMALRTIRNTGSTLYTIFSIFRQRRAIHSGYPGRDSEAMTRLISSWVFRTTGTGMPCKIPIHTHLYGHSLDRTVCTTLRPIREWPIQIGTIWMIFMSCITDSILFMEPWTWWRVATFPPPRLMARIFVLILI